VPRVRERKLAETIAPLIAAARADHDLIFVLLHWGVELDDTPGRRQVRAAHALIDAGADGVIAHHPHVLQGIERYKGGVIAYSLGNFVFRNARKPQRYTGVLRLGFARDGRCLDLVAFHPAIQRRKPVHHPEPATGDDFEDVAERVIERSTDRPLTRTTWRVDGERLVTDGACD
jgi:poly-gamma-glutamate synthesis protein (capsule biosynthesis protein)